MTSARTSKNKVNQGVRRWITIGAALDPLLSLAGPTDRSAILEEASNRHQLAPKSLLSIVKAYRYVRSHAKSADMAVEDVKSASLSIDVLMRIQKKAPQVAMDLRQSVFTGDYTYRELLKIEANIDKTRTKPVFDQVSWNAFSIELSYDYFNDVGTSWAFGPDRGPYSDIAKFLGVDLEMSYESMNACLFITPRIVFSEHRGQAIEIQIPKVFMSNFFYDRVLYLLWDDEEIESFERWRLKSKTDAADRIEVLHREEVAACYCFGDDLLEFGPKSKPTDAPFSDADR